MAIICRDLGLLFVLTPHTASSAVGKVLREQLGGEWLPKGHVTDRRGRVVVRQKHSSVREMVKHGVLTADEVDRLHVFTTVRNPFDRLVTVYHKRRDDWAALVDDPDSWVHVDGAVDIEDLRRAGETSFPEWLRHHFTANPRKRIAVAVGAYAMFRRYTADVDTVMRFEQIQDDFDAVLGSVGREPVAVPRFNPTSTRPTDYREYYDEASRRLVERAARWDLRVFGYEF